MSQMGFFDIANRYAGLDAKNDPLVKIDEVVPWEDFRSCLEAAYRLHGGAQYQPRPCHAGLRACPAKTN